MRNEQYDVENTTSLTTFEFVSEGPKGRIRKVVQYVELGNSGIYNLGFGDKIGETDAFDDKTVTNNGDGEKVLATVASTLYDFFEHHPKAFVVAKGSNPVRTRLYRISISNALEAIKKDFRVAGSVDNNWEEFKPNRDYTAFLITKK
jgi:hypothetical protein